MTREKTKTEVDIQLLLQVAKGYSNQYLKEVRELNHEAEVLRKAARKVQQRIASLQDKQEAIRGCILDSLRSINKR